MRNGRFSKDRSYLFARLGIAIVVVAQCFGTSLWFSPAGAAAGLIARWQLEAADFSWLLAATQLGFIAGTIAIGLGGFADRWSTSRLFALSCASGALLNACVMAPQVGFISAWCLRFAVGVCLAGIYPLGMKLVVQWVGSKPALALAWLVAMLTLGTAMPHVIAAVGVSFSWELILLGASVLALMGGVMVAVAGDGHYAPPRSGVLQLGVRALKMLAGNSRFRASAGGYFGHMWELYAFWAVVPTLCAGLFYSSSLRGVVQFESWLIATVIGAGALGCLIGGYAARRIGSAKVAMVALAGSGVICFIYPLVPQAETEARLVLLLLWGTLVVADSPQFSALVSLAIEPQQLGLALVIQNGIGFLISVISIVLLSLLMTFWGERALWILVPGPLLGLWAMRNLARTQVSSEIYD